jgi:hypothetical protein
MTHQPTEDEDYVVSSAVDDFAIADEDALDNPENEDFDETEQVVNSQTITEIKTYLKEAIAEQDSIDQIDLTEGANMTPTQQIAVHKLVKQHLVNIQNIIISKAKEG